MKTIPLTKGVSAIVDDEDYENLMKYSWCYHGDGYAARGYNPYAPTLGKLTKLLSGDFTFFNESIFR